MAVFIAEFHIFAVFDGIDQFVGELVALDVNDVGIGIALADAVGNGVEQMGLAHAGRAVDEQGIVHLAGGLGNGDGGRMGEPVGRTHHEIVKGELGVEVHGGGRFAFGLVSKRSVRGWAMPVVALASPTLSYLIATHSQAWLGGYTFSYEILILNAAIAFVGFYVTSYNTKKEAV